MNNSGKKSPGISAIYHPDMPLFSLLLLFTSSIRPSGHLSRSGDKFSIWFFNSSNAEATFLPNDKDAKIFENHLNPVMLVFIEIALAEYSQMSTHVPGFQSYFF